MNDDAGFLRTIEDWELIEGAPAPLGATWVESRQAYNFALYSRSATGVTLLLYTEADPVAPVHQIRFDAQINKTGRIWHCWVPAAQVNGATLYAYRVDGPYEPERGDRHDPQKVLIDPFAPAVFFPPGFSRAAPLDRES